jgi:regulator of sigma E protease
LELAKTLGSFLIVLGVLIFVHELGHFLVARWFGVRVLTFSLGFGPKILKRKRGDTEYCISLIPLGGYVKMAGETVQDELQGAPDEFLSKSKWVRFLVYLAGPAMNIALAVVLLTVVLANGLYEEKSVSAPPQIGKVVSGSSAATAGLQIGDTITAVDGFKTPTWDAVNMALSSKAHRQVTLDVDRGGRTMSVQVTPTVETKYELGSLRDQAEPFRRPFIFDVVAEPAASAGFKADDVVLAVDGQRGLDHPAVLKYIQSHGGQPVAFEVERHGQPMTITVTPVAEDGIGKIGVQLYPEELVLVHPSLPRAFKMSLQQNWEGSFVIARNLKGLITGETKVKQLMGPVAIAELSGRAASRGVLELLGLMAMISLNLALLNLMPVPVLDGGQIAILALEGLFRRNLSMRLKEGFMIAGALVIVALMVTVLYNDIARLVR